MIRVPGKIWLSFDRMETTVTLPFRRSERNLLRGVTVGIPDRLKKEIVKNADTFCTADDSFDLNILRNNVFKI